MYMRLGVSHARSLALAVAAFTAAYLLAGIAPAATYTWTGATSTFVDDSGNWNGLAGNFAASDFAYWNGSQAGALNLSLTGNAVMNTAAPGINLFIDSGQTSPLTINGSGVGTASTMRINSITINPARAPSPSAAPAWPPRRMSRWEGAAPLSATP